MGFGPWDLARLVLGAGNVGRHLVKENRKNVRAGVAKKRREDMIQEEIQDVLDPELEAKCRTDIDNPDKYDEIWDKLETYWRKNKDWCSRLTPEWRFVEGGRKPFVKDINHTYDEIEHNKRCALICLMSMKSKKPAFYAEEYIRRVFGG